MLTPRGGQAPALRLGETKSMFTPRIAPSMLASDFTRFGEEVTRIVAAGADLLHFDVMDGDFVPYFAISPMTIAALRQTTDVPFDVHIMVTRPRRYIDALATAGANLITFHIESADAPEAVIKAIHARGIKAGMALSPETSIEAVLPYLSQLDLVLPMSVEPGRGGQTFQPGALEKIARLRQRIDEQNLDVEISADGGVTPEIAPLAVQRGATILVAGTAIFRSPHPELVVKQLRQA